MSWSLELMGHIKAHSETRLIRNLEHTGGKSLLLVQIRMALHCWKWIADLTWQDITLISVKVKQIHLVGKVLVVII